MKKTASENRNNKQTSILVCLSASPSNQRVIHAASKLITNDVNAIALYVSETVGEIPPGSKLFENMQYARDLGFEIHTAQSNDLALTISEYAKRVNTTDLFLGYTAPAHFLQYRKTIPNS
ncbi:MAG: hypothetical protein IKG53_05690 [Solobacterium sp.]|nr:hypothetical protein [Solobacterium sp.]